MIIRDRAKQVMVETIYVPFLGTGGVVVVGDVLGPCTPFIYRDTYAGYRGAGSFATVEQLEAINNRLNYNSQVDEDTRDYNIYGDSIESFRPNVFGQGGR